MICSYQKYLTCEKALPVEKMHSIHEEILDEIQNDPDALELYEELIQISTRYASIRAKWQLLSRSEKMDTDSARTSCHNSVITHFNMLARYLRLQGKAAEWRDKLGYEEEDKYNRKVIGDFACYLVFINSISAR